jgi:hypothetical protein
MSKTVSALSCSRCTGIEPHLCGRRHISCYSSLLLGDTAEYIISLAIYFMRPLGRPSSRWIGNIKMGLLEIRVGVVDWIGLAQDRYRWRALVNAVMNLRVP